MQIADCRLQLVIGILKMAYSLILVIISFLVTVVWGRPLIRFLKGHGIGKQIRIEGPSSHQVKTGTPTMGGLMIIVPALLITAGFIIGNLMGHSVLVPLGAMVGFGLLGGIDDLHVVRSPEGAGILGRYKFPWYVFVAFAIAMVLYHGLGLPCQGLHSVALPGLPRELDLGLWHLPAAVFVIVGTANAVNFADGLDGLAGGIAVIAFAAYGVIARLQGQVDLMRLCFVMVGAILAFLWYNTYPAELFMGDVGSMALGAVLAVVALMTSQWLLLPIIGVVLVAETVSVILQVGYFKFTRIRYGQGQRIFKMAPLHHHFELLGWSETQVVQRFWLISGLAAMVGVALALL